MEDETNEGGADEGPVGATDEVPGADLVLDGAEEAHITELTQPAEEAITTSTTPVPIATIATLDTNTDTVIDVGDDEVVVLTKSDKAVSTNDTLQDLQRAMTYEAVFSSLIENKMLAMKRDCEEHKRAKRMKRKSIGRILFSRRLFGAASRKDITGGDDSESGEQLEDVMHTIAPAQSNKTASCKASRSAGVTDDIEVASESTESQRSQKHRSKLKTSTAVELPPNADDSITSTPSNSSEKHSGAQVVKRSLLVHVQTHTPAEVGTPSSSGESKNVPLTRLSGTTATVTGNGNANGNGMPSSMMERSYDVTSLGTGYDNGTGAYLHTSTMADDSLTSIRDSIESLSFASSRCTVSFGGTEIIPEDTASLLYERARLAKRLRILEAKSISAQCSPVLPRHPIQAVPPPFSPLSKLPAVPATPALPISTPLVPQATVQMVTPTAPPPALIASRIPSQPKPRFLPNQVSYTESIYSCVGEAGPDNLEAAYSRYFSRQNTSEDSANLTVSTLLNQSDSLSLHAPIYFSSATATVDPLTGSTSKPFSVVNRYKSKSTSLLTITSNGRSRPPPPQPQPLPTFVLPQSVVPTAQLEQLHITSNISHSDRVDSINNSLIPGLTRAQLSTVPIACTASPMTTTSVTQYYPVITTSPAIGSMPDATTLSTLRNGVVNGAIVSSSNMPSDTAKLHRMTSTSTGSSVAPTGCCTTTKSSSRDREKPRFKPSWPSGHTGSDDEYRRRKRKYKRYHRCSDPVLVYPSPSGLQHCILSVPPSDPAQYSYNEDFVYGMQLQIESDKNDDLEEIVPSSNRRHRRHRHHRHKKRHRHKKPKILVQDLETQVVKVIDSDDLPQRARWTIIATACLLLLMCLMLVGITLRMAPIIDDMGKSNSLLLVIPPGTSPSLFLLPALISTLLRIGTDIQIF